MTRKEAERQARMFNALAGLGIRRDDAEALRRISMTLHRWHEAVCNGDIEQDETSGKALAVATATPSPTVKPAPSAVWPPLWRGT